MRKTIFGRIFFSNLFLISLCLVVLYTLLFAIFTNHFFGTQKEALQEETAHVSELTVFYQDNPSPATLSFYRMSLEEIARRVSGVVFIVNAEGEVVMASRNLDAHVGGTLSPSQSARLLSEEYIQFGNFGGFFKSTYLLASRPIAYHGGVPAVSCVAVPVPSIHRYRNDVFRIALFAMLGAVLLSGLLAYFLSRNISKPLKNISLAAKSIAQGDFSVEVPVKGDDELAALSETFNQMTYSLKKLEDMRSGFIASVSHELRTPMTTISGFIEGILDDTIPKEEQEKYLTIVLSEAKRLSRLVNELLLVARMEGGLELKKSTFDMNEAVRIAILRFETAFTEKNVTPHLSFSAETCPIFADRDSIDRVLINLFDNALKFNCPGGYVRVDVGEQDGDCIVTVENSGEGISEENLQMIWDKFYKTDASRGKDKTGVGLGLYLVKNIIAAHGGKITAESTEGEFTRFRFTLRKK